MNAKIHMYISCHTKKEKQLFLHFSARSSLAIFGPRFASGQRFCYGQTYYRYLREISLIRVKDKCLIYQGR